MFRLRNIKANFEKTLALFVFLGFHLFSQNTDFTIQIEHVVGHQKLKLDSVEYLNALNQKFTVTKFKYYISQIILKTNDAKVFRSNSTYLIDEENASSKNIVLKKIPSNNYISIEFIIGVDSLHNCSGAQSDALDPILGMFWTWKSGYIFLKLEGKSEASSAPAHLLEYHIGGYKWPDNCIRSIKINLESTSKNKKFSSIKLKADVLQILENPLSIDFRTLPTVNNQLHATQMADNYKDLFSVIKE